ncbi:MAG: hypothetical protein ACK5BF_04780, partial [Hyphomonadaceae bacterium]
MSSAWWLQRNEYKEFEDCLVQVVNLASLLFAVQLHQESPEKILLAMAKAGTPAIPSTGASSRTGLYRHALSVTQVGDSQSRGS